MKINTSFKIEHNPRCDCCTGPRCVYDWGHRLRLLRRNLRDIADPFSLSDRHFMDLYTLPRVLAMRLITELDLEGGVCINSLTSTVTGYPQQPWLMVPIQHPEGIGQSNYNVKHRSAGNCIERCNGVLKTRFRCIVGERGLHYSPKMAGTITNAAILHNMMIEARVPIPEISASEMATINGWSFVNHGIVAFAY